MSPRETLRVLGWLVRDTFRQSIDSRVFWMMLGVSAVVIATCASVGVVGGAPLYKTGDYADFLPRNDRDAAPKKMARDGVETPSGELTLAFGALRMPVARDGPDAVRFIETVLSATLANTVGLLLALVWTAGFLPAFLAPASAAVLLSRPVSRRVLFLGKCLGVYAFVGFQTAVLVLGTWTALGARTGVWDPTYLLSLPLLMLQFVVFFSVSALAAARLRGTVACVLASLMFWFLCWGMNYGRHATVALPRTAPGLATAARPLGSVVELGYWLLPKPADLGMIQADSMNTGRHLMSVPEFEEVKRLDRFHPVASVVTSLLAAAALLALAVREFEDVDY